MVTVRHAWGGKRIEFESDKNIRFLLANRAGSYVMLPSDNSSRYDGFFLYDQKMFKIIDSLEAAGKIIAVENRFSSVDRERESVNESFFVPHHFNALVYEQNHPEEVAVSLDVKESYDNREYGRNYEVYPGKGHVIVKFTKKTDKREDITEGKEEYQLFLAIRFDGESNLTKEWKQKNFIADIERNSPPSQRYIFEALKIKSAKIVFSAAKSLDEAKNSADYVFEHAEEMKKAQQKYYESLFTKQISEVRLDFAYKCAVSSLDSLTADGRIFAGLPWFFQFWTRDEAVCCGAFNSLGWTGRSRKILFSHLANILPDGTVENRQPSSGIGSADGIGWCIKRIAELNSMKKLHRTEQIFAAEKLRYAVEKQLLLKSNGVFARNAGQETWMDTEDAGREGERIEIQALRLVMYKLLSELTKEKRYASLEKELAKKTREVFWDGKLVYDGRTERIVRPNHFIAYYLYPQLLSKKEWIVAVQNSMYALWNQWGGLASIDKSDPRFKEWNTGEVSRSYHNGDSWFWINNLAALCMQRLDRKHFLPMIDRIVRASSSEILYSGAIGHHAELSSSGELRSEGCLAQAWSAAMFIELVNELIKTKK